MTRLEAAEAYLTALDRAKQTLASLTAALEAAEKERDDLAAALLSCHKRVRELEEEVARRTTFSRRPW